MKFNLASTKLAFFLIAFLLLLIVLSAIIPQQDLSVGRIVDWQDFLGGGYGIIESLGLDRIYYTPTFFIVLALLAINLALGNLRRFRVIYRTEKTLLKVRHIGSVMFHLALLLTMVGVVLNYLYKYEGVFSLTEGQTARDDRRDYFREFQGPLHVASYGEYQIKLERIGRLEGDTDPLGSLAEVTLTGGDGQPVSDTVATNRPFNWGDREFHFGATVGYSPELLVLDSADRTLFRSFVRVSHRVYGDSVQHYDYLALPEQGLTFEITVRPGNAETEPPRYSLDVSGGAAGAKAYDLALNDTAYYQDYKLLLPRLRKWCYIGAIKNPFLNLIFTGFWLCLAGLSLSLVGRTMKKRTDT